jgi:Uma2 family endonuclease
MVTTTRLTLDEFLELPETEPPSEYIDGEVIQKVAPSWYHASLVHYLDRALGNYFVEHPGEARGGPELRHAMRNPGKRSFLPDISVVRVSKIPRDRETRMRGPVWTPPDFAIEVLSPGDYPGRVLDRADFYMRIGTELLWLVEPELETVTVIDARPLLSRFELDLRQLFAVLHEHEHDEAPD